MATERWIAETLFDDLGFRMNYRADEVIYELATEHQHVLLFRQSFFGKMLMIDGATQISEKDEFIYQEMMSHVPLFAHGDARDILIVGGATAALPKRSSNIRPSNASHWSRSTPRSSTLPKSIFPNWPARCSPTSASSV